MSSATAELSSEIQGIDAKIETLQNVVTTLQGVRETLVQAQNMLSSNGAVPTTTNRKAVKKPRKAGAGRRSNSVQNELTLNDAILQILGKKSNKAGLLPRQITETIVKEGVWKTNGNLSNMVPVALSNLKKTGAVIRNEDKTYTIGETPAAAA